MNGTSAFNILRRRSIRFAAAVAICALLFTGCSSTTSNAVNNDKVEADNITDITPASVPAQVSETAVGNKDVERRILSGVGDTVFEDIAA